MEVGDRVYFKYLGPISMKITEGTILLVFVKEKIKYYFVDVDGNSPYVIDSYNLATQEEYDKQKDIENIQKQIRLLNDQLYMINGA